MIVQAHRDARQAGGWLPLRRRGGFTLIELLVVVAVIAVLTSLTIPVISRVRDSARRVSDLSSLRQLTAASIAFAGEHKGFYPPGRVASAPPGKDDYTWISYKSCWEPLLSTEPGLNNINSCYSVREAYSDADDFGSPEDDYGAPDDTKVGWIYWAGRDDLVVDGKLQYRSMKRQGQELTPGSQTLWTCWCWDSAGAYGASMCPHVGLACVIYPQGVAIKPPRTAWALGLMTDRLPSFIGRI